MTRSPPKGIKILLSGNSSGTSPLLRLLSAINMFFGRNSSSHGIAAFFTSRSTSSSRSLAFQRAFRRRNRPVITFKGKTCLRGSARNIWPRCLAFYPLSAGSRVCTRASPRRSGESAKIQASLTMPTAAKSRCVPSCSVTTLSRPSIYNVYGICKSDALHPKDFSFSYLTFIGNCNFSRLLI